MTLRLEIPVSFAGLEAAQDAAEAWAAGQGVPPQLALRLRLVTEELVANLIAHATWPGLPAGAPPPSAWLDCHWDGGALRLVLRDAAAPFDPRTAPAVVPAALDDDRLGGLGLALVRRMSAELTYDREADGWNRTALALRTQG